MSPPTGAALALVLLLTTGCVCPDSIAVPERVGNCYCGRDFVTDQPNITNTAEGREVHSTSLCAFLPREEAAHGSD